MGSGRSSRRSGSRARPRASKVKVPEERAVARLAEDHVRPADFILVLENSNALLAGNLRAVGQAK